MRRIHRWVGLVSALFMVFVAGTGLALQVDLWATGTPPPSLPHASAPPPPPAALPDDAALTATLQRAAGLVRNQSAVTPRQLTLTWGSEGITVTAEGSGPDTAKLVIDPEGQSQLRRPPPMPHGYHMELQDLHAGYVLGTAGRVLSVVLALALMGLGVTGLVVYLDLFRRRRAAGRRGLFWH